MPGQSSRAAFAGAVLLGSAQAHAAEIAVVDELANGVVIAIDGDLEVADGEKFANLASLHPRAIVMLSSRGGSLLAGLRIGSLARAKGYWTAVLNDDLCASACAIAWLGGTRRFLGSNARLGFHAAYSSDGERDSVSGPGNALVGAYLDRLGLSLSAIYALTDAGPDRLKWLDVPTAKGLGIAVEPLQFAGEALPSAGSGSEPASYTREQLAMKFVRNYFVAGSADAGTAITQMGSLYGASVTYYGKQTSRTGVLADKRAFLRRWPERLYIPVERSMAVKCSSVTQSCRVTGNIQFECRSYTREDYSAGLASFAITVDVSASNTFIAGESSKVLVRR